MNLNNINLIYLDCVDHIVVSNYVFFKLRLSYNSIDIIKSCKTELITIKEV